MGADGEGRKNVDREGLKKAARLAAAMSPADRERVIAQLPGEIARALRAELSDLTAGDRADEALQNDFLTAWRTPAPARIQPPVNIPADETRDTDQNSLDRQRRQEYLDRLLAGELDDDLDEVLDGHFDDDQPLDTQPLDSQTLDGPALDDQTPVSQTTDVPADDSPANDSPADDGQILYRIDPAQREQHVPRFAPVPIPIRPEEEPPAEQPAPSRRPRRRLTIGWKIGPSEPTVPNKKEAAEPAIPWGGGTASLPREEIAAQCRRAAGERAQTIAAWLKPLSGEEAEEYLRCFPEEQRAEIRRRLERLEGVDLSIGELLGRHLGWPGAMGKEVPQR